MTLPRLHELIAVTAVWGELQLSTSPAAAAVARFAGDPAAAEAAAAACSEDTWAGALMVSGSSGERSSSSSLPTATLAFELPPRYPAAPLRVVGVSGDALPRAAAGALAAQLQAAAQASAGCECLHELAEALAAALAGPASSSSSSQAQQQQQQQQDPAQGIRRVLCRIDHMRSRGPYVATIRAWARELGLSGFLLFWSSLILLLLEGEPADVAEYLRRARTVPVDVDSAGRKCRERMMDVLEDSSSSSSGSSSGSGSSSQATRAHAGFRELELGSLAEVAAALRPSHPGWGEAELLALLGVR